MVTSFRGIERAGTYASQRRRVGSNFVPRPAIKKVSSIHIGQETHTHKLSSPTCRCSSSNYIQSSTDYDYRQPSPSFRAPSPSYRSSTPIQRTLLVRYISLLYAFKYLLGSMLTLLKIAGHYRPNLV